MWCRVTAGGINAITGRTNTQLPRQLQLIYLAALSNRTPLPAVSIRQPILSPFLGDWPRWTSIRQQRPWPVHAMSNTYRNRRSLPNNQKLCQIHHHRRDTRKPNCNPNPHIQFSPSSAPIVAVPAAVDRWKVWAWWSWASPKTGTTDWTIAVRYWLTPALYQSRFGRLVWR